MRALLTETRHLYGLAHSRTICGYCQQERPMDHNVVYRFAESGLEATDEDLRRKQAGDTLAALARQHVERKGGTFSDALRAVMSICPQETREYFRQG